MIKRILAATLLGGTCMPFVSQAETVDTCTRFIDSLPATVSTQGVYCLRKDLTTSQATGYAILVDANNVTIDCNGYKVGGLNAGIETQALGIRAWGWQNVTVRNCNVRGFYAGVYLKGAGHLVEDNSINRSTRIGIYVDADGGLIRNNRVLDTGSGTNNYQAYGIFAYRNTDVLGNTVDGVVGTVGRDVVATGIRSEQGTGVSIANNTVRNIAPTGAGDAQGVFTVGNQLFIDNNRVSLPVAIANSVGYRCIAWVDTGASGALRGNSSWGFETPAVGCHDSGGNVFY